MNWYIGCSGFHYKEWKGSFYPDGLPQREWFEFYSGKFNTLELNVTFYRFPQLAFLKNWYEKSPTFFLFSVKVPRLITHYKQCKDVERLLGDFYGTCREGLKHKLGPILFQLPPQMYFNEERLLRIMGCVDKSFDNVIEFRHASWWIPEVMDELGRQKIAFCGSSFPKLPEQAIVNTSLVYYRFHGMPVLYHSEYAPKKLRAVADAIRKNKSVEKAFIYFNNTASSAALHNATYFNNYVQAKQKTPSGAEKLL